ncbi:hypothetical protein V3C99_012520 [Haemonchus contortus]|uniref:Uncharacterized protein n=1 Tax=Haemonchus contortus TaxID=6289 RepID=A0A7I4Z6W0_HAECO
MISYVIEPDDSGDKAGNRIKAAHDRTRGSLARLFFNCINPGRRHVSADLTTDTEMLYPVTYGRGHWMSFVLVCPPGQGPRGHSSYPHILMSLYCPYCRILSIVFWFYVVP